VLGVKVFGSFEMSLSYLQPLMAPILLTLLTLSIFTPQNSHSNDKEEAACEALLQSKWTQAPKKKGPVDWQRKMALAQQDRTAFVEAINTGSLNVHGRVAVASAFRAEEDPKHQTMRMFPQSGRFNPEAKAHILFLHGTGYSSSNGWAMRDILFNLCSPESDDRKSKMLNIMAERNIRVDSFSGEAISLPFHQGGPASHLLFPSIGFESKALKSNRDWLISYIESIQEAMLQEMSATKPIIIFTRSGSAFLAGEVQKRQHAQKSPKIFADALVLMSPNAPGNQSFIDYYNDVAMPSRVDDDFTINEDGTTWVEKLLLAAQPWSPSKEEKLQTAFYVPGLIFIGSQDVDISPGERQLYKQIRDGNNPFDYHFLDLEHDAFLLESRVSHNLEINKAYEHLYRFLNRQF